MKDNSKSKATKAVKKQAPESLRDLIEIRAYEIWFTGGCGHGNDLQHWLQAEAEILKATEEPSGPAQ
jgi:hypothetical protein